MKEEKKLEKLSKERDHAYKNMQRTANRYRGNKKMRQFNRWLSEVTAINKRWVKVINRMKEVKS